MDHVKENLFGRTGDDGDSLVTSIAEAMVSMASSRPPQVLSSNSIVDETVMTKPVPSLSMKPPVLSCLSFASSSNSQGQFVARNQIMFNGMQENEVTLTHLPLRHLQRQSSVSSRQQGSSLSFASFTKPYLPLQNKTNIMANSSNQFFQSVVPQSQENKIKDEFSCYVKKSQAQLKEMEDVIHALRQKVESYQGNIVEMRRQKEVYLNRGSHAFQELQEDLRKLLQKVVHFGQTESLGTLQSSSAFILDQFPDENHRSSNTGITTMEPLTRLKSLEDKMISLEQAAENLISVCKVTQDNVHSQMTSTVKKLDQIIEFCVKREGQNNSIDWRSSSSPQSYDQNTEMILPELPADRNEDFSSIPENSLSQDSNQSNSTQSFEQEPTVAMERRGELSHENGDGFVNTSQLENTSQEAVGVNGKTRQFNGKIYKFKEGRRASRKQLFLNQLSRQWKRIDTFWKHKSHPESSSEDHPPVLSLPSRIVKNRNCRMPYDMPMPILYPECTSITSNDQENKAFRIIQLSSVEEKPKLKELNNERNTIKVKDSSKRVSKKLDFWSESEEDDEDWEGDDRRRGRVLNQIKMDIHGIKKERVSIHSMTHARDFSKIGYVCMCGAKFTGAGGLYVHQVKMMEVEKFKCDKCGKRFHYFSGLKAHRKTTHKMEFTQQVGCSRCGQIFNSKKERQGHVDERGKTCWLSGSYQSKDWELIRNQRLQGLP